MVKVLYRYFKMKISTSKIVEWTEDEYAKFVDGIKIFLQKMSQEASETKEASIILKK